MCLLRGWSVEASRAPIQKQQENSRIVWRSDLIARRRCWTGEFEVVINRSSRRARRGWLLLLEKSGEMPNCFSVCFNLHSQMANEHQTFEKAKTFWNLLCSSKEIETQHRSDLFFIEMNSPKLKQNFPNFWFFKLRQCWMNNVHWTWLIAVSLITQRGLQQLPYWHTATSSALYGYNSSITWVNFRLLWLFSRLRWSWAWTTRSERICPVGCGLLELQNWANSEGISKVFSKLSKCFASPREKLKTLLRKLNFQSFD